jgi:UDP-N-acetylmuramate dehydrogenase
VHIHEDFDLRLKNSFRLDCRSRWFCRAESIEDIEAAIAFSRDHRKPIIALGGGTNLVLAGNLDALVVEIANSAVTTKETLLTVAAGENWHRLVQSMIEMGLSGIENLALIPGTVGAAPIQNIGAYGVELAEVFDSLTAINVNSGEICNFSREECRFGYRDSLFRRDNEWLIVEVKLRLRNDFQPNIEYSGISEWLDRHERSASLQSVFDAIVDIRTSKLPDPVTIPNVGSFFKNPIVASTTAKDLSARFEGIPIYPVDAQTDKLSAAWLIDRAGLKGRSVGDIAVSAKHALVLVNNGKGSGADVRRLVDEIQQEVLTQFGVALDVEPCIYP